tara:strand:+ start:195 stop:512 length:318 start_codon:yes stop_codon:yes gene_type:complete
VTNVYAHYPKGPKYTGTIHQIDDKLVYIRLNVKRAKHMLQIPPAWCIDKDIADLLDERGVSEICLLTDDGVYSTALEDFFARSFSLDRGHNPQWALELKHWRKME